MLHDSVFVIDLQGQGSKTENMKSWSNILSERDIKERERGRRRDGVQSKWGGEEK